LWITTIEVYAASLIHFDGAAGQLRGGQATAGACVFVVVFIGVFWRVGAYWPGVVPASVSASLMLQAPPPPPPPEVQVFHATQIHHCYRP